MEFLSNIKRILLGLTILTIVSSISSEPENMRFSKLLFASHEFETREDQEFSGSTRVKRETNTTPCPFDYKDCSNIPNVDRFRTYDGTCNNKDKPYCGASNTPHIRLLDRTPPGDQFRCPNCPRARDVSYAMNNLCYEDHNDDVTVMIVQWGQFTDHDLTFTPEVEITDCCEDFETLSHPSDACRPIDVRGDLFYDNLSRDVNCLPFIRSRPSTCAKSSDRETVNDLTSYLDASMVYGSNLATANGLRSFIDGKLKVSGSETLSCPATSIGVCPRSLLPIRIGAKNINEYFGGDTRVEEQPSLTSIHTLFVRLHNDIASIVNCGDDEITYQVTRKIVGAIVQQITFNEFLPTILGDDIMHDLNLDLDLPYEYNKFFCASTPSAFATAAFRFGHSLIPHVFQTTGVPVVLSRSFENHHVTRNPNAFPSHFISGIINQNAMPMDQIIVDALHNKLFAEGPNFEFGSDLYARNIQRGRDHGVPGYVDWYNSCVGSEYITSFEDLYDVMPDCVVEALEELYESVYDIDLFPAGVAEFEVNGGVVGPTFACIIAVHFHNLKFGDRFWFQNPGFFTTRQVASIRRTLLSSIICKYTNAQKIQPYVMNPSWAYSSNYRRPCEILQEGVLKDLVHTNIWSGICNQSG